VFCSLAVLEPRVGQTPCTYFLHLSLSSVILIDSSTSTGSPVHVLMLPVQARLIHRQCQIKVGAIDAAALGPFKKQPRTRKRSLLAFGCDVCGWYNFGEIIKTVTTRCHILKLKCTKFDFGWGSASDPTGGAYSAPQAS